MALNKAYCILHENPNAVPGYTSSYSYSCCGMARGSQGPGGQGAMRKGAALLAARFAGAWVVAFV